MILLLQVVAPQARASRSGCEGWRTWLSTTSQPASTAPMPAGAQVFLGSTGVEARRGLPEPKWLACLFSLSPSPSLSTTETAFLDLTPSMGSGEGSDTCHGPCLLQLDMRGGQLTTCPGRASSTEAGASSAKERCTAERTRSSASWLGDCSYLWRDMRRHEGSIRVQPECNLPVGQPWSPLMFAQARHFKMPNA